MKKEEKLLKIINHYEINNQLRQFNEETFELNQAISEYQFLLKELHGFNKEAEKELIDHITEEIADVSVMLEQFKLYYKITDGEIQTIMHQKIDRQLERIANE